MVNSFCHGEWCRCHGGQSCKHVRPHSSEDVRAQIPEFLTSLIRSRLESRVRHIGASAIRRTRCARKKMFHACLRSAGSSVVLYRCTEPPPFHVRYSGQKALIAIETLALLRGRLSPRALGLVTEWAAMYRAELMEDWNLARADAQLKPIAPLE